MVRETKALRSKRIRTYHSVIWGFGRSIAKVSPELVEPLTTNPEMAVFYMTPKEQDAWYYLLASSRAALLRQGMRGDIRC